MSFSLATTNVVFRGDNLGTRQKVIDVITSDKLKIFFKCLYTSYVIIQNDILKLKEISFRLRHIDKTKYQSWYLTLTLYLFI
jgi:hypothetical protein